MLEILRVAAALASRLANLEPPGRAIARIAAAVVLGGFGAAIAILAAVGCAAAGLWIYLQQHAGPVSAAFITAAALLVLAVILVAIAYLLLRRKTPRRRRRNDTGAGAAAAQVGQAVELADRARRAGLNYLREHKTSILLTSLVGGVVFGSLAGPLLRARRNRR
jgi:uncharacterized membrane protein